MNRQMPQGWLPARLHPWAPEQRLEIARRHLMAAARQYDERGSMESHKALMIAVAAIEDAEEAGR